MGGARLTAALLLCTCASSSAPPGFLPTAEQAQRTTRGGWIIVVTREGVTYQGELIAVDPTTLYVFDDRHLRRLVALRKADAWTIHFEAYQTQAGLLSVWTTLASAATVLHGVYMILTLPATIL